MNACRRLKKLQKSTSKRLARLRAGVTGVGIPLKPDEDRLVAWTVIEALSLWSAFLRAYYLSGAMRTKTTSGAVVSFRAVKFSDEKAALRFAIRKLKDRSFKKAMISRRDEPPWHDSQLFLTLQKTVAPTNLMQVYSAFSVSMTFSKFLPTIRNFYAHRCDETFRKATRVGVALGLATKPKLRPTIILCSRLPKRPQSLIADWLDEIKNVIDLLCS